MNKLIFEIDSKFRSGSNHAFLFHLNIDDLFLRGNNEPKTLTETLLSSSPLNDSYFTVFFNLATGIRFNDPKQEEKFIEFLSTFDGGEIERFNKNRLELGYAISFFTRFLKKSRKDTDVKIALSKASKLNSVMGSVNNKEDEDKPLFSIVIEYLETIVHPESACSSCSIDRSALVAHLMWAKDPVIRRANNIIILITDSLTSVAPQLRSDTGEIAICKVGFPNQPERESVYSFTKAKKEIAPEDLEAASFAK